MRARMRIQPAPRRARPAPVVPMINVVFLLLVFFLLAAHIGAPGGRGPTAVADLPQGTPLELTAEGVLRFGAYRGTAAINAAILAGPVILQADGAAPLLPTTPATKARSLG